MSQSIVVAPIQSEAKVRNYQTANLEQTLPGLKKNYDLAQKKLLPNETFSGTFGNCVMSHLTHFDFSGSAFGTMGESFSSSSKKLA